MPRPDLTPSPALVAQSAVQRLPRLALLLFCAAYVLPGLFGRDPWRNADITAFGYMASLAQGHSPWWAPSLGGLPGDAALLPYWIGAAAIRLLGPWLDAATAARLPFALLLVLALVMTWYSSYHLARTEAARPLPFAFGGEADPVDYARAIADGALLALMATLGLLQLGHETTPELAQLACVATWLYALAASPFRPVRAPLAALLALPALAASGAPSLLWFTWPTLPLAAWTVWRWRRQWRRRHVSVPLGMAAIALLASTAMGGVDRALMLALPALAVLTAFALPTLQRSTGAAIDWFSVFFFSLAAIAIWVVYLSLHTGVPAQPAANVAKLAPGFEPAFSGLSLLLALAGSAAWVALVVWRTGRNRHPLWKSMVLPASGVALGWLLLMTLWLPLLDYARSERPLVQRVAPHLPRGAAHCVAMPGAPLARIAAIEQLGGYTVDAVAPPERTRCSHLLRQEPRSGAAPAPAGWELVARIRRPTERSELTAIYRRRPAG
ncbi:hypothetical protein ABXN37_05680 [Piscinibacter sakaiensis]|uniref:hypothetical protein n=1 Tax=Piscinibacter sakaiensis TaxID=1547922 RepID=UPI0037262F7C